jgi:hypothetical protein
MRSVATAFFTFMVTTCPVVADALSDQAAGCPGPVVYGLEANKKLFAVLDNIKKVYSSASGKTATLSYFKCEKGFFNATIVGASDKVNCVYSAPINGNEIHGAGTQQCRIGDTGPFNISNSFEFSF